MSFKEIIRLISERHTDMTEVTDALSDMMHTVKDRRGTADSQGYAPIRSKMGL